MATISRTLAELVSRRHGVVTHDELLADGHTHHAVRRLVEEGLLVTEHKRVYRLATSPDTFEARCAAASSADPCAIVTGVAAARLWEFRHVWRPDVPHVMVAHDRTPITRGVVLRRSNVIAEEDIVDRSDGIRVASPPRAWFDCARDLDDERFERLTEWVFDNHATLPTLWRTARRLERTRTSGSARVKRVMSRRSDWQSRQGPASSCSVLKALERRRRRARPATPSSASPNGIRSMSTAADPTIDGHVEVDHVDLARRPIRRPAGQDP